MKLQQLAQSYYINRIRALSILSKKKAARFAFNVFCKPFSRTKYTTATGILKEAELLNLKYNELNTVGYRWNKGGHRKIYIAHGFGSSAANFSHFAKKLVAKNYEVIAFDAPAHGKSEGVRITAMMYKNFIEEVNKKYGSFDGYVCHSFGGMAVSFFLAEISENENIKIALIAPASDTGSLSEMFFGQMKICDKKVQQYFLKEAEKTADKPIDWFSIKRCTETLYSKILWLHDEDDTITPITDALIVKEMNLPNIEFVFTKGLGHRRIYRDDRIVNRVTDFL
jgi:pimeloyl-ACP methyl ester carboxylesterase